MTSSGGMMVHLFALAVSALLLQGFLQFGAGQGLAVTNDVLRADAELVAQQFGVFEGAADLASNLGGRGRGGRGGSSNLGEYVELSSVQGRHSLTGAGLHPVQQHFIWLVSKTSSHNIHIDRVLPLIHC
jgi:hypothetical protein